MRFSTPARGYDSKKEARSFTIGPISIMSVFQLCRSREILHSSTEAPVTPATYKNAVGENDLSE